MVTVARTVEEIIKRKPFLQESLLRGIINYGALAEELLPEVEKQVQKSVKHAAVMMALRRLTENLQASPIAQLTFTDDSSIIAQDGLVDIVVNKNKNTMEKAQSLFDKVQRGKGDFLTVTHGVFEITIIAHRKNLAWLKKAFSKEDITAIIEDLSALTITIPLDFMDIPGFFYMVTRALAWENINVEEIVSTSRELTLIVKSDDTPHAFNVLKKLTRNQ